MKHGRYDTIEGGSELSLGSVIVDVRNQSQKFHDWIIYPKNFAKMIFGLGAVFLVLPVLMPLCIFLLVIFGEMYSNASQYAPMRYPAWSKMKDPGQLDPGTDKPQSASGIMYFGVVDAKDPYTRSMQVYLSADDLTRHMLVLGTTGSGKSEFLKGMTFNVLCWASGYFVADAKADNKLPTDLYSQIRMFGRDYDFLVLNYLLGGLSPAQIATMRERLSNGVQPATVADADTLVQMTSNMMVKASGDGKSWQDRGLNMYRGICRAVVDKRDRGELTLSMEVLREYLALDKIEELYIHGWKAAQANGGIWPSPYLGVKSYLEIGLPGFKIDVMLRKYGLEKEEAEDDMMAMLARGGPAKPKTTSQSNDTYNQHGYRADQVYPALSLVVDTYGHIFKRKHPEIDMQDVVVNSRICVSLIPSLEKGSQEQESLGKLNLALLRVMMARALGMSVEGDVKVNVDAKITASKTPFALFLDEFAYQFAEGIALTAAQARSLNFFLCALAQDLEKLMEGDRLAEAGAMMANQATKFFMKIVGSDKTHELATKTLGEAQVAVVSGFEKQTDMFGSVSRDQTYRIEKRPRIERKVLEELSSGFATFAYRMRAHVMRTFYPSAEVPRVRFPRINRFLQIPDMNQAMLVTCAVEIDKNDDRQIVEKIRNLLDSGESPQYPEVVVSDVVQRLIDAASAINAEAPAIERGIALYQAGIAALEEANVAARVVSEDGGGGSGSARDKPIVHPIEQQSEQGPSTAMETPLAVAAAIGTGSTGGMLDALNSLNDLAGGVEESSLAATNEPEFLVGFDPDSSITQVNPSLIRKDKCDVFPTDDHIEETIPVVATESEDDAVDTHDDLLAETMLIGDMGDVLPDLEQLIGDGNDEQPVSDVRQEISQLANTPISSLLVDRMGDQVVGLKPQTLESLESLEVALGAESSQAALASKTTERAVSQTLTVLDESKGNLSSQDFDSMFNELENLIDSK